MAALVALTCTTVLSGGKMRVRLNEAYVNAIRAAGLIPLILPPAAPNTLADTLQAARGLVLTGGEDVDPAEYDAAPDAKTDPPHRARDAAELALARMARERRLPTLAICRGLQVVNVAFGGTLVQDIPSACPAALPHDRAEDRDHRVHDVTVEPDTLLARTLGTTAVRVNSSHHQALAAVADGLRVVARAPDGIVEGAEWRDERWWMLGVQWHPEELVSDAADWDRKLFAAFAARIQASG